MSRSRAAVVLWGVAIATVAIGATLSVASGGPADAIVGELLAYPAAATVGALIFARVPNNPIGWIFLGVGLLGGLSALAAGYADSALLAGDGSERLGDVSAALTHWLWAPTALTPVTFGLLLFPDGRLPSRRWRPIAVLAGVGIAALSAFVGLSPADEGWRGEGNPYVEEDPGALLVVLGGLAVAVVPALAGSVAAVVVRFRRSSGRERQQLKWLTYGGAIAVAVLFVFGTFFDEATGVGIAIAAALGSIPVWIGIAILRHRLYDIDVVINRTLVYGALTATLAGAYIASVLLLQLVLSPGSDLAIAGSTLAVAALFRPARSRIQAAVDRRFYRQRYDAARTLERFGARLRDEIDLDALAGELRGLVADTMQPAHLSLWLRGPEVRR